MNEKTEIDTSNLFFVGSNGDTLVFTLPVPRQISKEDALNLAAWIVAIVNPTREEFDALHKAVCNTDHKIR